MYPHRLPDPQPDTLLQLLQLLHSSTTRPIDTTPLVQPQPPPAHTQAQAPQRQYILAPPNARAPTPTPTPTHARAHVIIPAPVRIPPAPQHTSKVCAIPFPAEEQRQADSVRTDGTAQNPNSNS